ncbi:hypothetical protein MKW94_014555 [Papaver nudicaule]|uniref:Uncharacterized protein n=1 Tax=Papaver nudicaule TaxID=74823 RepID=A0AA41VK21_PAPNU|nr:hypothetical protein [Papaver nudicaule]
MVRAPCCEKMGLKKGPWTVEEDQILITYISHHGHGNWRALPKQAGLLRCGKSCRLRWTNYLRPDIKRGNFSSQEEETIIMLHEMLGNRWSAIAARLPGRTDNEIKNVWHTHLKKRLLKQNQTNSAAGYCAADIAKSESEPTDESERSTCSNSSKLHNQNYVQLSPQHSSSDFSSSTEFSDVNVDNHEMNMNEMANIDENIWSQAFSTENFSTNEDYPAINPEPYFQIPSPMLSATTYGSSVQDVDFWYKLLMEAGELF